MGLAPTFSPKNHALNVLFKEISTPTPVIRFPYHSMHLVLNPSMIKILKSGYDNNFLKTQI